jgi:chromosomal replication initiation ATPase DnaA
MRDIIYLSDPRYAGDAPEGWRTVCKRVALESGFTLEALMDRGEGCRRRPIVIARSRVFAYLYEVRKWSYPRIGILFGIDHTSVMNAYKKYGKGHNQHSEAAE